MNDCAVIGIPSEREGEVPKAFMVPNKASLDEIGPYALKDNITNHVKKHKSRSMWLDGGIEFVESIPKNPSGKILRRILRDQEKLKRKSEDAQL